MVKSITNILTESIDNMWPMLTIFLVVIAVVRIAAIKNHNEKLVFYKEFTNLLFIIYILLLYELLTRAELNTVRGYNLVPFSEMFRYEIGSTSFYLNVVGNIVIFIPFGYLISTYIKPKRILSILIVSVISSATVEFVQLCIGRSLTFEKAEDMRPASPTRLQVQAGTEIDLTTSGSMLVAGKTRSGKTTGIIALLLQVLLCGRDEYGSEVIIIDPKRAELSRLPYVVALDEDGEARGILDALKRFSDTIVTRQAVLNNLSEQVGDAVKWWDAGMHPSFLFVDEFVSLKSIFPAKPAKDDPDYCISAFDSYIKRIVTMGASAGCYVIISIAEASVQEGGLPAMLRSAMSTRILFRPTRSEGLLLWDKVKLDPLPERVYGPGDAWFSSTDGEHDAVSYVHFPLMDFPVYKELGRLLTLYYEDDPEGTPPPPCET